MKYFRENMLTFVDFHGSNITNTISGFTFQLTLLYFEKWKTLVTPTELIFVKEMLKISNQIKYTLCSWREFFKQFYNVQLENNDSMKVLTSSVNIILKSSHSLHFLEWPLI